MTTEDTAETDTTTEEAGDRDPAWYREQIETVKGQRDAAVAKLERLAYRDLGLDPKEGMGKAVSLTFDGDIDPEDTSALKEHAATMGWEAEPETPVETTSKPEISDAEGRSRQLESASMPAEPNALKDEGQAAVEAGDAEGAIAAFVAEQMQEGTIDLGGPD